MRRNAHAHRHEQRAVRLTQEPRTSGVRRANSKDEQLHRSPNERSTVPAARGSVLDGASAADMYAQIVAGKLADVGERTGQRPGRLLSSQARTRDQFLTIGSLDRIPIHTCTTKELFAASIDHRQGFVLSLVDGATPIESIVDASPQAMHQVLSTLTELLSLGLIGFRS
jgi:hypothetical protein